MDLFHPKDGAEAFFVLWDRKNPDHWHAHGKRRVSLDEIATRLNADEAEQRARAEWDQRHAPDPFE